MPKLFARFCALDGEEPEVTMLAYPGRYLDWHMKEYFPTRFNILYGNYDYCVIQQGAHPFPEPDSTWENASRIIELCKTVGTKPIVEMTWAEKRFPENQQQMIDIYQEIAEKTDSLLAPVGLIWQTVQKEHPDLELYWQDGEHAGLYGDYLVAATLYAIVRGKKEVDLPPIGMDFFKGKTIEADKPIKLVEDPKECEVELDKEKTDIINQTITKILSE